MTSETEGGDAPPVLSGVPPLLDRVIELVGALRRAGVPVSVAESVDAAQAACVIPLLDREVLRSALAATTVKRAVHRVAFDTLFDLYFPPVYADGAPSTGDAPDGSAHDNAGAPGEHGPDRMRDAMRERLAQLIGDGDDEGMRVLAREAVGAFGRAETQPGRQSWFAYRVLRRISPETLTAGLLSSLLGDAPRGGLDERLARQAVNERTRDFTSYVEVEVRRRLAEERGPDVVAATAVQPLAEQVDFLRANREQLAELRRAVGPLARRLGGRLAARRRRGRDGRLDFRRTVRASLATGGVPLDTHHRPPRPHKPELVVLCDISGSVAAFAQFTLLFVHALREQFSRVRAFAFVDTCDEVTRFFDSTTDVTDAVARMTAEARVVWFDGHSDYGHAFEVFAERWADALTPRTSLLVLGDARNNYRDPAVPTLSRLVAEVRHAYWLNPEPRAAWGSGDSAAAAYRPVIEMVECRTVAQLEEFVHGLLPGSQPRR